MRRMPGVVTFNMLEDKAWLVDRLLLAASKLVFAATSFGGLHSTADRRAQWGDDAPGGADPLLLRRGEHGRPDQATSSRPHK